MVKCLGSDSEIESIDEVFDELDQLRSAFKMIITVLTSEEYLEQCGAGEATGPIMDQGMMLALANERLERLTKAGRFLMLRGGTLSTSEIESLRPADLHGEA